MGKLVYLFLSIAVVIIAYSVNKENSTAKIAQTADQPINSESKARILDTALPEANKPAPQEIVFNSVYTLPEKEGDSGEHDIPNQAHTLPEKSDSDNGAISSNIDVRLERVRQKSTRAIRGLSDIKKDSSEKNKTPAISYRLPKIISDDDSGLGLTTSERLSDEIIDEENTLVDTIKPLSEVVGSDEINASENPAEQLLETITSDENNTLIDTIDLLPETVSGDEGDTLADPNEVLPETADREEENTLMDTSEALPDTVDDNEGNASMDAVDPLPEIVDREEENTFIDASAVLPEVDGEDNTVIDSSESLPEIMDTVEPNINDTSPDSIEQPTKTADIVTTKDFLLNATGHLDIDVSIPELVSQRAYINVCHVAENFTIDYGNCLLNKPFINGHMQEQLMLSNDVDYLHMEIWVYDIDSEAYRYQWRRENGLSWIP